MLKIDKCQNAKSDIVAIKALNDLHVAYCTSSHGIEIIDIYRCDIKKNITNQYLDSSAAAYAFSSNSRYFSFATSESLYIIDLESENLIQTIQIDDEEIEIISFDASSIYIIVGTKSGRVLQYRTDQTNMLSRLCSFGYKKETTISKIKEAKSFVSAFAFYKNLFACSGYDGTIYIIDINTQANRDIITHNKSRLDALCFLDENRLFYGNDEGIVGIYFIDRTQSHKVIRTSMLGIKQLLPMPNPNFLLVVGNSKSIMVIDTKEYKIIHRKYIEFESKVQSVDIVNNDLLVVSLANNTILSVELRGMKKLNSLIAQNLLEESFELIEKEPMLQGSYEHKRLHEGFERSYTNAIKALINQDTTLALQILDPYKNIKLKQKKIKELFDAFKNYPRFKALVLEEKYALTYAMSTKYEPLKNTPQYKKMEKEFKTLFVNAQRAILKNNLQDAKELLRRYSSTLCKKPLINMLLTQNREFIAFLKAIQKRDFNTINQLLKINKLFKEIPNYLTMQTQIRESLQSAELLIKEGNIEDAKRILLELEGADEFENELEDLYKKCRYMNTLQKAYADNDFIGCYEVLDMHKYLKSVELGVLLENHYSKLMQTCEEYALDGNIKGIRKTLGELITLYSRRHKIGDLLRVSFHVKIQKLLEEKNFKASEAIIYSYIDIFGIDSEMKNLMKNFEKLSMQKLAITEVQTKRPRRDNWRNFDIFMSGS